MADESIEALLGRRVREMRKSAGLTQAGLAERAGLAFETISRLERGKAKPTIGLLAKIADALGVSAASLIEVDEDAVAGDLAPDLKKLVKLLSTQPLTTRSLACKLIATLVEHESA